MAQDISVGKGIGLQSRVQSYVPQAIQSIRRARQEEAAAVDAARRQRAKDLDDLNKYQEGVNKWTMDRQSGLLPIDQDMAKAKAQKIFDYVSEKVRNGENVRGDSELYNMQLDLQKFYDLAKNSADNLLKQGSTGIEHPDKFTVNQSIIDLANSQGTPENYEKWRQTTGGTGHYMSGLLTPIDKTDWLEDLQKNVIGSGLRYQSVVDPKTGKRMGLQAPTQAQIDNTWENAKTQSWYNRAVAQQVANGIDEESAEDIIKRTFVTSIPKDVSMRSMEESEGSGSGQTSNYTITPLTNKTINIDIPQLNESGQIVGSTQGQTTARKSWELKTTIPIQKETLEVFDPTTWQKEKTTGAQEFKISSIIEVPVLKAGPDKGKPTRTEIAKKFPQNVEWKKYASGTTSAGDPKYIEYEAIKPVLDQKKIVLEAIDVIPSPAASVPTKKTRKKFNPITGQIE